MEHYYYVAGIYLLGVVAILIVLRKTGKPLKEREVDQARCEVKRTFGIERFYKKVFTIVLGSVLIIIPFYAGALQMLLLTDKVAEWQIIHWIFFGSGIVLFVGGMMLNKLAEACIRVFESFMNRITKK